MSPECLKSSENCLSVQPANVSTIKSPNLLGKRTGKGRRESTVRRSTGLFNSPGREERGAGKICCSPAEDGDSPGSPAVSTQPSF